MVMRDKRNLRLGILAGWSVGSEGGDYYTLGCHGRYLEEYCEQVGKVKLIVPVGKRKVTHDYQLGMSNLDVVALPEYHSYAGAMLHIHSFIRLLLKHAGELDAVYVRVPDPYCWLPAVLLKKRKSILMHICGDMWAVGMNAMHHSRIRRALMLLCYAPEWGMTKWAIRRNRTLINGKECYDKYHHLNKASRMIISTTLRDSDFFERGDTCQRDVIKLLYVGFLRAAKGLDGLIEVVKDLHKMSIKCELNLVGEGESRMMLETKVNNLGIEKYVKFTGYVPHGDKLNEFYRQSDIFVFPSLTEGSPRVVLDALAQSLPVVASRVGSIPEILTDGENAVMFNKNDKLSMRSAIVKCIDDGDLRRRCISGGFMIARNYNVSAYISSILEELTDQQ
jgi:glycosyltransferase involved in cell wall biosynthesis